MTSDLFQGTVEKLFAGSLLHWSEASLEAGELQLVDRPPVGEGGSGDATGGTSFFAQPHLPVKDPMRKKRVRFRFMAHGSKSYTHCRQKRDFCFYCDSR